MFDFVEYFMSHYMYVALLVWLSCLLIQMLIRPLFPRSFTQKFRIDIEHTPTQTHMRQSSSDSRKMP